MSEGIPIKINSTKDKKKQVSSEEDKDLKQKDVLVGKEIKDNAFDDEVRGLLGHETDKAAKKDILDGKEINDDAFDAEIKKMMHEADGEKEEAVDVSQKLKNDNVDSVDDGGSKDEGQGVSWPGESSHEKYLDEKENKNDDVNGDKEQEASWPGESSHAEYLDEREGKNENRSKDEESAEMNANKKKDELDSQGKAMEYLINKQQDNSEKQGEVELNDQGKAMEHLIKEQGGNIKKEASTGENLNEIEIARQKDLKNKKEEFVEAQGELSEAKNRMGAAKKGLGTVRRMMKRFNISGKVTEAEREYEEAKERFRKADENLEKCFKDYGKELEKQKEVKNKAIENEGDKEDGFGFIDNDGSKVKVKSDEISAEEVTENPEAEVGSLLDKEEPKSLEEMKSELDDACDDLIKWEVRLWNKKQEKGGNRYKNKKKTKNEVELDSKEDKEGDRKVNANDFESIKKKHEMAKREHRRASNDYYGKLINENFENKEVALRDFLKRRKELEDKILEVRLAAQKNGKNKRDLFKKLNNGSVDIFKEFNEYIKKDKNQRRDAMKMKEITLDQLERGVKLGKNGTILGVLEKAFGENTGEKLENLMQEFKVDIIKKIGGEYGIDFDQELDVTTRKKLVKSLKGAFERRFQGIRPDFVLKVSKDEKMDIEGFVDKDFKEKIRKTMKRVYK